MSVEEAMRQVYGTTNKNELEENSYYLMCEVEGEDALKLFHYNSVKFIKPELQETWEKGEGDLGQRSLYEIIMAVGHGVSCAEALNIRDAQDHSGFTASWTLAQLFQWVPNGDEIKKEFNTRVERYAKKYGSSFDIADKVLRGCRLNPEEDADILADSGTTHNYTNRTQRINDYESQKFDNYTKNFKKDQIYKYRY